MAKRMNFSVIGLPHYTIWHLYEPSVDDLRHMEEMELERQALEREEAERAKQRASLSTLSKGADFAAGGSSAKIESLKSSEEGSTAQPAKDAGHGASKGQSRQ